MSKFSNSKNSSKNKNYHSKNNKKSQKQSTNYRSEGGSGPRTSGSGSFKPQTVTGMIKRHADGFGFLIVDNNELEDVFVPAQAMNTAMTNDKVSVRVEQERDGRYRGEIVKINERSQKKVAGKYFDLNAEFGIVKDEGKGWGQDLKILKADSQSAKNGQLVVALVKTFPDQGIFQGEISEIIGDPESALNDVKRVIINQNIPDEFSAATLEEAKQFNKNPSEKDFAGRRDLRKFDLITIDGATAKDFDDAVFTEMKDNGFHLIVAIADVSHYVQPNTSIDREAYERGTSVYFPNFVVPMLPEALSNGLCSLNPHVPRLALVADMHFDFNGEMKNSEFYEAVIESKARVTYGEAQQLIDDETSMPKLAHVKDTILRSRDLAKLLMALRFKNGSLDLEVPETELVIDGTGEPIDVIRSERLFAHRLIEELMLAANVAVAKFLTNKQVAALYRIHESPDPLKIAILQKHLEHFGSTFQLGDHQLQKRLTKALQEFENKTEASVVHILTLRSMSQAKYTTENIGHFGLGFQDYTHFTSPIRRYPDLIVHRLVKSQIGVPGYRQTADDDLQTAGTWLSACEQRSAKAERQIQSIKKSRFMRKHLGEEFDGVVSSITKFGMFVLLKVFNVDGLVRLENLGSGKWIFDEENLRLVNKGSGFAYKLGDSIKVSVSAVDVENGQINFELVGKIQAEKLAPNLQGKPGQKFAYTNPPSKSFQRRNENSNQGSGFRGKKQADEEPKSFRKKNSFRKDFVKKDQEQSQKSPLQRKGFTTTSPKATDQRFDYRPEPKADSAEPGANKQPVIKPRYSSLSDYLDKNQGTRNEKTSAKKPTKKHSSGSATNREDSKKRSTTADDSSGVRKARPEKSYRKNKPR
jgi:ribonuclease R